MTKLVKVAVGVIQNASGDVFIAQRAASAHQGGLWEFPGGKLEANETTPQALARELHEELAIQVNACEPLIQIKHDYLDKSVLLDVYRVTQFSGAPIGNEGQPVRWVAPSELDNYEFPAANKPIISALRLPSRLAISGEFTDAQDLQQKIQQLPAQGITQYILRLDNLEVATHKLLVSNLLVAASHFQLRTQLNCSPAVYQALALQNQHCGLHLKSNYLMELRERPLEKKVCVGASCHNLLELKHAEQLQLDYALLSPVLPTNSHPNDVPLGWEVFQSWVAQVNIPVYALGGVGDEHLATALSMGAQGVAGISAWWPAN